LVVLASVLAACRPVIEDPTGAVRDTVADASRPARPSRTDAAADEPASEEGEEGEDPSTEAERCDEQPAGCDAGVRTSLMSSSKLLPYSAANPILYSNDHPEDVHTDVLMMALRSNGSIDLRAVVTDQQSKAPAGCDGDGCHTAAIDDGHRREWISAARESGFQHVLGSTLGDAAVDVIVREARAASAERPLLIIVGGPLTLLARAYTRDPSIAGRVIVSLAAFSFNDATNGKYRPETNITVDVASAKVVFEHLRVVVVPFADFNSAKLDEHRYPATPLSRVKALPDAPLRARMESIYAYPWAHYDADGGPSATLLSERYVRAVKPARWAEDSGGPYLADDPSSDDLVVSEVDGASVTEPWWREVKQAFGAP
jgi:hypothetical protein